MRSRLLVLILVGSLGVVAAQVTNSVSATGFITATLCGQRGANAQHIDHAKRSVASGKAKCAIYDEASKKLYILEVAGSSVQGAGSTQAYIEQYLGQRVKITGTLSPTPPSSEQSRTITRAGQSYAPDAVATPIKSDGNPDQSNPPAADMVSGDPAAASGQGAARVQGHRKALDVSTPIAGVLTISSVEAAPIQAKAAG